MDREIIGVRNLSLEITSLVQKKSYALGFNAFVSSGYNKHASMAIYLSESTFDFRLGDYATLRITKKARTVSLYVTP